MSGKSGELTNSRTESLQTFLTEVASRHPDRSQIVFVCIGTDRSTGDSFGPLVGSKLEERGWPHVFGTLKRPCDAERFAEALEQSAEHAVVIAVDACLGKPQSVGGYITAEGPLIPGQATGARLSAVGHYSIAGVVNASSHKPYMTLQTTSLYAVMQMAETVAELVDQAWKQVT
ncbi:putative sporulation protein YyaC [Paenibacillus catalpae]|uniref:Putative sporulation protein YyaC n=1 Tax=Paenibacillus catalpae TaxID=1045775 RepID=A0A1I2HJ31_9BACL|nr:spore protease YyaC [Paenibacillus catalpae]SFF29528.1 putative sporulation protein YyaC [Paenibacillus catalpae]